MTTLTEIVATVVVHSSAAALSHFGVTLEPAAVVQPASPPQAERVVSRTPRPPERKLLVIPKARSAPPALRV